MCEPRRILSTNAEAAAAGASPNPSVRAIRPVRSASQIANQRDIVSRTPQLVDVVIRNHILGQELLVDEPTTTTDQSMPAGVSRVVLPAAAPGQIAVFAGPDTNLQSCISQATCTYVWGFPAHPDVARSEIGAWAARVLESGEVFRFRELLGTFIIIIDEPQQHRVTFINDVLGIRPFFVSLRGKRLRFGSDVWAMHRAGFTSGEIDYQELSAWIGFSCSCSGGTLFADLRRLSPGTVTTYHDGRLSEHPYTAFSISSRVPGTEEAADVIHHIVSSTAQTLFARNPSISLALSGGFDSRYLLALALQSGVNIDRLITVSYPAEEGEVARQVADVLGVAVEDLRLGDSEWDTYAEPYHFSADGFPISKHLTYRIAQQAPGLPLVNGFLGGIVVRGHDDTLDGKYESQWGDELAAALQRVYLLTSFDIFRKDIAERIEETCRSIFQGLVQRGRSELGKGLEWFNLYSRQRFYISNNFLQHLSISEALLPFYSWELLQYKVSLPYSVFNDDVYLRIFRKHCPPLAEIIHSDYLQQERGHWQRAKSRFDRWMSWSTRRPSQTSVRWARELLPLMANGDWLSLLSRRRATLLILAALVGHPVAEAAVFVIRRLYLLEQRLRAEGLECDWHRL